jgi:breast cancer 2 susceptibility protein
VRRHPFVATLRSLSPDGGYIPLIDIVIKKVYPIGFVGREKKWDQATREDTGPWGEAEEMERAEAWKVRLRCI